MLVMDAAPTGSAPMGTNPLAKSSITGVAMQALMVMLGKLVPAIGAMPNFYAICGTVVAALTGSLAARDMPAASAGKVATTGAMAGGATSVVGGLLAVVTGQWPDFAPVQILFPFISGAIGGGFGGLLGRMFSKPKAP
jgi:CHASE2 domain-containing sensor protein